MRRMDRFRVGPPAGLVLEEAVDRVRGGEVDGGVVHLAYDGVKRLCAVRDVTDAGDQVTEGCEGLGERLRVEGRGGHVPAVVQPVAVHGHDAVECHPGSAGQSGTGGDARGQGRSGHIVCAGEDDGEGGRGPGTDAAQAGQRRGGVRRGVLVEDPLVVRGPLVRREARFGLQQAQGRVFGGPRRLRPADHFQRVRVGEESGERLGERAEQDRVAP